MDNRTQVPPESGQFAWVDNDPKSVRQLLDAVHKAEDAGKLFYSERYGNVISVFFEVTAGWEKTMLLRSDVHWDSTHCERELVLKHMKMAQEKNGLILDGGDLMDAMQGRFDPRRSYDDIRPEYLKDNKYYDNIVEDVAESHAPYAPNMLLLARGNHETAVTKNANTDLTDRVAERLRSKHGSDVYAGGYGGWVRFVFLRAGRYMTTVKLRYFHGAGGAAPVTKGVIQTNRQGVFMVDADIIWNGHNHQSYQLPTKRERMSVQGRIYFDMLWHIRTPGYKNEYQEGEGGWAIEKGGDPRPFGGAFINLSYSNHGITIKPTQEVE